MGYKISVDYMTYDNIKTPMMRCTGVSEAIVLKIIESLADRNLIMEINKEVNDELQDN